MTRSRLWADVKKLTPTSRKRPRVANVKTACGYLLHHRKAEALHETHAVTSVLDIRPAAGFLALVLVKRMQGSFSYSETQVENLFFASDCFANRQNEHTHDTSCEVQGQRSANAPDVRLNKG